MTLYFTPRQLECPGTVAGCGMIDPPPKRVNVSSPTISAAIAQPAHAAFAKTQAVALAPKAATAFANPFGAHTEFDLTRHALKTSLGLQLYIRRHAPGLSVTQGGRQFTQTAWRMAALWTLCLLRRPVRPTDIGVLSPELAILRRVAMAFVAHCRSHMADPARPARPAGAAT